MKSIDELKDQVRCYEEVLAHLQKPFCSAQEETAAQLFSRLLFDATKKLKMMEREAVKLHYRKRTDEEPVLSRSSRSRIDFSTSDHLTIAKR